MEPGDHALNSGFANVSELPSTYKSGANAPAQTEHYGLPT